MRRAGSKSDKWQRHRLQDARQAGGQQKTHQFVSTASRAAQQGLTVEAGGHKAEALLAGAQSALRQGRQGHTCAGRVRWPPAAGASAGDQRLSLGSDSDGTAHSSA